MSASRACPPAGAAGGIDGAVEDLIQIAQAGGNFEVDARQYSLEVLLAFAQAMTPGSALTLTDSEGRSTYELASIVAGASGRVTIA